MRFKRDFVRAMGSIIASQYDYDDPIGSGGLTCDCFGVWTLAMRRIVGNPSDNVNFGYVSMASALNFKAYIVAAGPLATAATANYPKGYIYDPTLSIMVMSNATPTTITWAASRDDFIKNVIFQREIMFGIVGEVDEYGGFFRFVYDHFVYVDIHRQEILDLGYSGGKRSLRRTSILDTTEATGLATGSRAIIGIHIPPVVLYNMARFDYVA